jgi:hypothetical protein
MAERKKVKGKKPTETMRQAQRRKLAEQRAKKARAKGVKTNPTGPARGAQGPARPPVQGPSRRTPSTMGGDTGRRGGVNKYGTKGTPKSGPPGIGKRPRFNPRVRRPGANPASLAAMTGLTIAGKMAETIGKPGQSKMSGTGIDPKRLPKTEKKSVKGRNTKGGQGGSRAAVKRKPQQPAKSKRTVTSRNRRGRPTSFAKPAKRGMSNIPPKEGTGMGSPNDRPKVKAKATPKATTKAAPKPKVKKSSGVSGVGPVKSGRAFSVAKTGKSVSRQRVDELRAMRERSKKRQAAQKKKK